MISAHGFNMKCSIKDKKLSISVIDNIPVTEMIAQNKESIDSDKWINTVACPTTSMSSNITCTINDLKLFPKVLKIILVTDMEDIVGKLWLYHCFENHGAKDIATTQNKDNGRFELTWEHYEWDNLYWNKDIINITNVNKTVTERVTPKVSTSSILSYEYRNVKSSDTYEFCIETTFFSPFEAETTDQIVSKCIIKSSIAFDNSKSDDGSSLSAPLIAVGIGIALLLVLCIAFLIYNKKCKQGGDHDFDMNKHGEEEQLNAAGNDVEMGESSDPKVENKNLIDNNESNGENA